ncbi:MAG: GatB/YqeY domain-containing protein [Gammaproteobacteria bacterium AqS3]|nr:GatB/YqeY domain-containing protein [Gammaproteobacteria bacterium AqS3]
MSIKAQLKNDVKEALKAGERLRLDALRMTLSEIQKLEIKAGEELAEADLQGLLIKLVKQRRENAETFAEAGRTDLAEKEAAEAEHLSAYLPEQLSGDALAEAVSEILAEAGVSDIRDMGRAMGAVKRRLQGRADLGEASSLVKLRLSGDG